MSRDKVMTSPTRFNGELDHFFDPNFTEEISHRMQVPKRIKVTGDVEDDASTGIGSQPINHAWEKEKFEMHVPERILVAEITNPVQTESLDKRSVPSVGLPRVLSTETLLSVNSNWRNINKSYTRCLLRSVGNAQCCGDSSDHIKCNRKIASDHRHSGQDQLLGTRGIPIEANHENAVMPADPNLIRVQTPPRVLTLSDHYFPTADDIPGLMADEPNQPIIIRPQRPPQSFNSAEGDRRNEIRPARETTPSLVEGMPANEEIAHLRRQLAKLNRRVMSIELENLQRQQYEKIVFVIGITYTLWKALLWLRNS